ncbi:diguanylate cyclase (GGDEF)-like protein [Panacagrimonas perspica]|uniref:diguanylate cyclase n=1 Tax=Panacagrimonas perspica TaxID=381431 RepID=A0A4S3K4I3_9GAMM|nr:diguanylate cyclase (GGDEF)-like protein [Panacagrimonas perspica]THD02987.1 hypothetical protein B1810_10310 [Panacagrimonas perspica]
MAFDSKAAVVPRPVTGYRAAPHRSNLLPPLRKAAGGIVIDEHLDSVVRLLATASGIPLAAYFALDEGKLVCRASSGAVGPDFVLLAGLWHHALDTDGLVKIEDVLEQECLAEQVRFLPETRLRSYAALRVKAPDGAPIGVLCLLGATPQQFSSRACTALDDARRLLERDLALRHQAERDPLTGLSNRRRIDDVLTREWKLAVRDRTCLSVLAIDIDHFKLINDRHGHAAGDQALHALAQILPAVFRRPGDCASRIGGDEFIVCLPRTDSAAAVTLAQRLRQALADICLTPTGTEPVRLTLSIGVATAEPQAGMPRTLGGLLAAADAALYAAKEAGRDCVSVDDCSRSWRNP